VGQDVFAYYLPDGLITAPPTEKAGMIEAKSSLGGSIVEAVKRIKFIDSSIVATQDLVDPNQLNLSVNQLPATQITYGESDALKHDIAEASDDVQSALMDLDNNKLPHLSARVVAESNIDLLACPAILSGITLVDGEAVLLVKQTAQEENGLYIYVSGILTRYTRLSKSSQFVPGLSISVREGLRAGSHWVLITGVLAVETDPVVFITSALEESLCLRVLAHPTNKKRVIITPAMQTLNDGQVLIQELQQLPLYFTGAEIDFTTGTVYKEDGITPLGINFSPIIPTVNEYRWFSITVVPKEIDAQNRMVGQVVVIGGTADNALPEEAPRAPFASGKPLSQVVLKGDGVSFDDIEQTAIQRLTLGAGGGGQTSIEREVPAGLINGTNDTFTLVYVPMSKIHTMVFVDRMLVEDIGWNLQNDNEIKFEAGYIPTTGQYLEVQYFPDPLSLLGVPPGGGTSTDLTNIVVDIQPDTSGNHSVGTVTKPWKDIFLKDKTTAQVWRLEVDSGVLQAVLVP
jgi:hypothetical protein